MNAEGNLMKKLGSTNSSIFSMKSSLLMCFVLLSSMGISSVSAAAASTEALLEQGDVSVTSCAMEKDCSGAKALEKVAEPGLRSDGRERPTSDWRSLGLRNDNLHVNHIAVGFAPGFRESKSPNTPAMINRRLPRPMAIVGDYYSLTWNDLSMRDLDYRLAEIKNLKSNPVWSIALMPKNGLDMITYDVAHRIAIKMKKINEQGIKVWLRFGHEMNGDWNVWGMKPKKFVRKWRILAKAVKSVTSGTYMLWSPNALFGHSVNDLHGGYTPYWPGADVVDIAGISFYHWGDNAKRINIAPTPQEAVQKLHDFSKLYGPEGWGKPIVVAETAASYTYNRETHTPVRGGASEYKIKMTWLHLLLDKYIKQTIPGLRAVVWFEIVKDENATGNTAVKTEDFRLVLGNPKVGAAAHNFFRNLQKT